MTRWRNYFLLLCMSAILVTACANLNAGRQEPKITLNNLKLQTVSLFEQHFVMTLRVSNPDSRALEINGLAFDVYVNNEKFASAVGQPNISVEPYSSALVDVEANSNLLDLFRQIANLEQQEKFSYRLEGHAAAGGFFRVPFKTEGVFEFNK